MSSAFDVVGMKKLKAALKQLDEKGVKRAMKSAIRAGGSVIVKEARNELKNSSFNYQTLSASLGQKVLPTRRFGVTTIIGPRTRFRRKRKGETSVIDGWYAHIVEFGTLGSRIKPLARGSRRKQRNPMPRGLRPQPFMRPGFDKAKGRALDITGKKLWKAIKREADKRK